MMTPTLPEDQTARLDLDPMMWVVWGFDVAKEEIRLHRVVPDQATAEGLAAALAALGNKNTGCYPATASYLFAAVREQGRLEGKAELLEVLKAIRGDIEKLAHPAGIEMTYPTPEAPSAPVAEWWNKTHGNR